MSDTPIPRGVSRETLFDVVRGWYAAGAAEEPVHTATVADDLDLADSVGRQTAFLESLGVLQPDGQQHRLSDAGAAMGRHLSTDHGAAREDLRRLLWAWDPTEEVRSLLSGRSLSATAAIIELADRFGADPDVSRDHSGLSTLLDCYLWAGLVESDGDRYEWVADEDEPSDRTLTVSLEVGVDLDTDDVGRLVAAVTENLDAGSGPVVEADIPSEVATAVTDGPSPGETAVGDGCAGSGEGSETGAADEATDGGDGTEAASSDDG
ncbi:MAG: hypothetical protein ABEJ79_03185 [Halolamina sp.]